MLTHIRNSVAVALIYHALILITYLMVFRGDWSAMVCVNRDWIQSPPFEAISTGFDKGGYDGQFYYLIARDPFQKQTSHMDVAGMRHIRVSYPLLAWAISGGDTERLLYVLPMVNLLAILLTFALFARLTYLLQRPWWWGCMAAFGLNSGMSLLRDLTDPLATMALVGLLVSWYSRDRAIVVALWCLLAVFAREQNAAAVGVVLLDAIRQRRFYQAAGPCLSLIALIGWILYLKQLYGHWPFISGNMSYPLQGILWRLQHLFDSGSRLTGAIHLIGLSAIVALLVGGVVCLGLQRPFVSSWLILGGWILTLCGSDYIYASVWSYHRVFTYLPLGVALWCLETGRRGPLICVLPGFAWPILAVAQAAVLYR